MTGRWANKDPVLFNGGNANVYAYAGNDPVSFIDPSGLIGAGVSVGEQTDVGVVVAGAGQNGSAGVGVFFDGSRFDAGGYLSWGGFLGGVTPRGSYGPSYPPKDVCPTSKNWALGGFGGGGVNVFVTNADNLGKLRGPFEVYSLNAGWGVKVLSIQLAVGSDGTWVASYGGPLPGVNFPTGGGYGIALSHYSTNTWTSH